MGIKINLKKNYPEISYICLKDFHLSIIHERTSYGGDYMIPVGGMKLCTVLPGSRQCYKLFINYVLQLHVKFHPGKTGSHFCTAEIPPCRDKIFPCNRFSSPNRDEKVN